MDKKAIAEYNRHVEEQELERQREWEEREKRIMEKMKRMG